ncbi:glycosyltransferase [Megasphaera stantonii]|uniref:glycosyltransferase n=1 Tax=Megasphaera stantonii TaxID=2144175 RepID=UPI0023F424A8|nr:glycosyltransferase [Megasphaera stantonii]
MLPEVQVLMSTYNGEKYLEEQIESILQQKNVKVNLLVRDDGSTDRTIDILKKYADEKKLKFYLESNIGYAKSFMNLLWNAEIGMDYYAFSDQDDVWLPEKLISGINKIKSNSCDGPILYASALQRVNANLEYLKLQKFDKLVLSLGAEFTRHRLAGCTFIFNKKLLELLTLNKDVSMMDCSHDKLATILCLACGGKVIFDKNSYILFRRHDQNASVDGLPTYKKICVDICNFYKHKNNESQLAKKIAEIYSEKLDGNAHKFLCKISFYRTGIISKIKLLVSSDINCGFWYYNLFVKFMIVLGKF